MINDGKWEKTLPIRCEESHHEPRWRDYEGRIIVPPNEEIKRKILRQLHDHWGAGHAGRDKTMR
jgi:hypothetical protein